MKLNLNLKTKPNQNMQRTTDNAGEEKMALTTRNYILLLIGFAIIVIGFALMCGGASYDTEVFNYEMFSWRRITLAPIVVVGGFAFEIYAIMKKF